MAKTLRTRIVPTDELKLYRANPRRGNVEAIKESLLRNGQYRPIDPLIYILDYHWPNDDRPLLGARATPPLTGFEPLPVPVGPRTTGRKAGAR